jgi:hypothetical protein
MDRLLHASDSASALDLHHPLLEQTLPAAGSYNGFMVCFR